MKVKSTFPARKARTSPPWWTGDAKYPSPLLQLMQIHATLGFNRLAIRWMSVRVCKLADYLRSVRFFVFLTRKNRGKS